MIGNCQIYELIKNTSFGWDRFFEGVLLHKICDPKTFPLDTLYKLKYTNKEFEIN